MPNLHKHLKWAVPLLFFVALVAFFTFAVAPSSEASELIASAAPEKIESVEIQVERPAPSPECVKVSSKEDPSTWD